MSHIN